jgi:hypothetical protein
MDYDIAIEFKFRYSRMHGVHNMKLDFRYLNKVDGPKVLQVRSAVYVFDKPKKWYKPYDVSGQYLWTDWHTIREENEVDTDAVSQK